MAQKISLKGELSLQQIFAEIRKQTSYAVIYGRIRGCEKPRTGGCQQPAAGSIHQDPSSSFPLCHNISGSNIIIIKREIIGRLHFLRPGKRDIHGLITDSKTNQPLPGVTIIINGTRQATQTDAGGKFVLKDAPDDFSITITSVGYEKQVRKVSKTELYLPIPLSVATSVLDEAVVQGLSALPPGERQQGNYRESERRGYRENAGDESIGCLAGQGARTYHHATGRFRKRYDESGDQGKE